MTTFHHTKKHLSQIPALMQLINLGYESAKQALEEHGERYDNVLLKKNILRY